MSIYKKRTTGDQGQVLLEAALVLPLFLLATLGTLQVLLLAQARIRVEGAVDAAARSVESLHAGGSAALAEARVAAAIALLPAAPPLTGVLRARLTGRGSIDVLEHHGRQAVNALASVAGTIHRAGGALTRGVDRLPYALLHTHIRICRIGQSGFPAKDDALAVDVAYDAPIVMPLLGRLLADLDGRVARADAATQLAPIKRMLPGLGARLPAARLRTAFGDLPKRTLRARTGVLWQHRGTPGPWVPACAA